MTSEELGKMCKADFADTWEESLRFYRWGLIDSDKCAQGNNNPHQHEQYLELSKIMRTLRIYKTIDTLHCIIVWLYDDFSTTRETHKFYHFEITRYQKLYFLQD